MNSNHFEPTLPDGYREVYHLDARSKKAGTVMSLASLLIAAIVVGIAFLPAKLLPLGEALESWKIYFAVAGTSVAMLLYTVLHELVHGAAYKGMTGAKLSFGISWSCAFCGVPNIYTYRKTALVALTAPLLLFSILLGALCVFAFFVNAILYWCLVALFAMHLGGCVGDIYLTLLLLFKYKSPMLLMRDTGPEMWIYLPENIK